MYVHGYSPVTSRKTACNEKVEEIRARSVTEGVTSNPAGVTCPSCIQNLRKR